MCCLSKFCYLISSGIDLIGLFGYLLVIRKL